MGIHGANGNREKVRPVLYLVLLIFILIFGMAPFATGTVKEKTSYFRFGFSANMFTDVNENDALAAVKIWLQTIARERGILTDTNTRIFTSIPEIASALKEKTVEGISMTTVEYLSVHELVHKDKLMVGVNAGSIMEEYVLLVHGDSDIRDLDDLKDRRIGILRNARASLVPAWLDILLAREEEPPPDDFFREILWATKMDKLVHQVFFGQTEACIVTRSGFEVMIELNPQIGQQLKALATSPPVVPVVTCFRKDETNPFLQKIMDEIALWDKGHVIWQKSPAIRQILTLFQADSIELYPDSCLDTAVELLAEHNRFFDKTGGAGSPGTHPKRIKPDTLKEGTE